MAYTPIGWLNDQAPAINQTNLNKMDNQIAINNNAIENVNNKANLQATDSFIPIKNMANPNLAIKGYLSTGGVVIENNAYETSGFILVESGKSYVKIITPTGMSSWAARVCLYDNSLKFVQIIEGTSLGNNQYLYSINADGFIRFSTYGNLSDAFFGEGSGIISFPTLYTFKLKENGKLNYSQIINLPREDVYDVAEFTTNMANPDDADVGYLNSSGVVVSDSAHESSGYIRIESGKSYVKRIDPTGLGGYADNFFLYDELKNYIGTVDGTSLGSNWYTFASTLNGFVRFSTSGKISDAYFGIGSVIPSTIPKYGFDLKDYGWIDYSQVKNAPRTDVDDIVDFSANKVNPDKAVSGYLSQGVIVENEAYSSSDYIKVENNKSYVKLINPYQMGSGKANIFMYDKDLNYTGVISGTALDSGTTWYKYDITANGYIRFSTYGSMENKYFGEGNTIPDPVPEYSFSIKPVGKIDYSQVTNTPPGNIGAFSGKRVLIYHFGGAGNDWCFVRTPASYDYTRQKPYPFVICNHGNGWVMDGTEQKANWTKRTMYVPLNDPDYIANPDQYNGTDDESLWYSNPTIEALLNAGYVVCGAENYADKLYGNNNCRNACVDFFFHMIKNFNVEDRAYMIGASNGAMTSLNAAYLLQGRIKAMCLQYPLTCLVNQYESYSGHRAEIRAAYGITDPNISISGLTKAVATHDPLTVDVVDGKKVGVFPPTKMWYSQGDTLVNYQANTLALASMLNNSNKVVQTVEASGQHGDASHFDPEAYLAWFNAN